MTAMIPMLLAPMFEQHGYSIGSLFSRTQSFSQAMVARSELGQMRAAEDMARELNVKLIESRLSAFGAMTGTPPAQGAYTDAARTYNKIMQQAAPFTGMLDQFMGTDITGIITPLAGVGSNLGLASFGFYKGKGQFGLEKKDLGALTEAFIKNYTRSSGEIDYEKTLGMSLPMLSKLAVPLQGLGVLGRMPEGDGPNNEGLRQKYIKEQVVGQIDKYKGVVAMMREISGSNDTDELIRQVQGLTGGSAGQVDPQRLTQMVGQIREVARTARMSMEVMSTLVSEGAAMARNMGVSSVMGARLASQNVLVTHAAMTAVGNIPGSPMEYAGKPTDRSLFQTAQAMSLSIAEGPMMGTIAAGLHILGQSLGGPDELWKKDGQGNITGVSDKIKSGSDIYNLLEASRTGDKDRAAKVFERYRGAEGKMRYARDIAEATGGKTTGGKISEVDASRMLYNDIFRKLGQTEFDLGALGFAINKEELARNAAGSLNTFTNIRESLAKAGINNVTDQTRRELADLSFGSTQDIAGNVAKWLATRDKVDFDAATPAQQKAYLDRARPLAVTLFDNMGGVLRRSGYMHTNQIEVGQILAAQDELAKMKITIDASRREAVSLLGAGAADLPGKLSDFFAAAASGKSDTIYSGLLQAIGAIPNENIKSRLQNSLVEYHKLGAKLRDDKTVWDPGEKEAAEIKYKALSGQMVSSLRIITGAGVKSELDTEIRRLEDIKEPDSKDKKLLEKYEADRKLLKEYKDFNKDYGNKTSADKLTMGIKLYDAKDKRLREEADEAAKEENIKRLEHIKGLRTDAARQRELGYKGTADALDAEAAKLEGSPKAKDAATAAKAEKITLSGEVRMTGKLKLGFDAGGMFAVADIIQNIGSGLKGTTANA
jgi:hypothetical protein